MREYSVESAVNYANRYYENYNPAYPDWTAYGGDCANFISQCLHAGGIEMHGIPGTVRSATNFTNWFSAGNKRDILRVSSTWRGADAFRNYWQAHAKVYQKFAVVGPEAYKFGHKGDFISLLNANGTAYHTLLIVGYADAPQDFIIATHTFNTNSKRLSEYAIPGGFLIYSVR